MMERNFRQQTFTVLLVIFAVCYTVIEKWSRIEMSGVRLRQEAHVACVRGRRRRRNNALAAAGEGAPHLVPGRGVGLGSTEGPSVGTREGGLTTKGPGAWVGQAQRVGRGHFRRLSE